MASGSDDFTVKIWDSESGLIRKTLIGHTEYVRTLTVLQNGDLASGSQDLTIKIWNRNTGFLKTTLEADSGFWSPLVILANGDLTSVSHSTIKIWDKNTGIIEKTFPSLCEDLILQLKITNNNDLACACCRHKNR